MSHGPFRTATDHKNGSEQRYIGGTQKSAAKKFEVFENERFGSPKGPILELF